MAQFALVVGIASYLDAKVPPINFAEADATRFKDTLERIGFEPGNIELLVTAGATQDAVRLALKQICGSARTDDEVIVYLSGHGMAYSGANHFLCYDSPEASPPSRTLPLSVVLDEVASSPAKRVMLFLDCCHAGLKFPANAKGAFAHFSKAELVNFFYQQEFKAAFCSCGENELSYTSEQLQHSIWTYYVLQALNAEVPDLLEERRYLNGAKLQDYLFTHVPPAVRKFVSPTSRQTPLCLHKHNHSPLIADLQKLVAANADARVVAAKSSPLVLQSRVKQRISDLTNFREDDQAPTEFDHHAENLVKLRGNSEVLDRRSKLFDGCRRLGYKLAQIKKDQDTGAASLATPDFEIDVWITQDVDAPGDCCLFSTARIIDEKCLEDEECVAFLNEEFDEVALTPQQRLDLHQAALILEELSYVRSVKVDADSTFCDVYVPGDEFWIRMLPSEVVFESSKVPALSVMNAVRPILGRLAFDGIELHKGIPALPVKSRW